MILKGLPMNGMRRPTRPFRRQIVWVQLHQERRATITIICRLDYLGLLAENVASNTTTKEHLLKQARPAWLHETIVQNLGSRAKSS
jgi:hypothetical protein